MLFSQGDFAKTDTNMRLKTRFCQFVKIFFPQYNICTKNRREYMGNNIVVKMKDVPKDERPRERLLKYGAEQLSNQELIAILVGSGTRKESVLDLATRIIMHFEGIKLLSEATIEELTAIKGVGIARGVNILAAIELGKRIKRYKPDEAYIIRSPKDGANFVMEDMQHLKQEHLVVLFLNTKNQIVHKQTIFIGSLNASIVHPREIFREAVKRAAASIICVHNHPSGDPLNIVS